MQTYFDKNSLIKWSAAALAVLVTALAMCAPLLAAVGRRVADIPVVVVDAGHGGADAGVTGVRTGVKESDLNLKIALLLGEYLASGGIKVVYTREGDYMRPFAGVTDNKKRADMFYRGDVINSAKPSAVISVHINFYRSPSRRGAQTFFDRNSPEGRELANIAQDVLNRDINPELGGREYSALSAEKYILQCSPYPAMIAECGFLSNPLDEAALLRPDFQAEIAYALFQAAAIFLSSRISVM